MGENAHANAEIFYEMLAVLLQLKSVTSDAQTGGRTDEQNYYSIWTIVSKCSVAESV